jgi:phage terminase small subunit
VSESPSLPKPPKHLWRASAAWWRALVARYAFEPHQLRVLTAACESWDRKELARERVEAEGLTFTNKYGELKPHPAVAIERDARLAFLRAVRELALADDGGPADVRPPRIAGRYEGRN